MALVARIVELVVERFDLRFVEFNPCPDFIAADIVFMSDDDKGGPKGPKYPDPDEIRKTIEGMFGKMGKEGFSFPGMAEAPFTNEEESDEVDLVDPEVDDIFQFDLLPRDIKAHLDRFVIRQDEAKKALAIAVCDHYNHVKTLRAEEGER